MPNRLSTLNWHKLTVKIENLMRNHDPSNHGSMSKQFLWAASLPYGAMIAFRRNLYQKKVIASHRLPVPVISVGNLAAGGTGKTPMTIYLALMLQNCGLKPAVISRGYGGSSEKKGCIVSTSDSILADSHKAGDEPVMMAKKLTGIPVIVGKNRFHSGKIAVERFHSNVILLDDGFQHMALHRDLDIVLMDAMQPVGNGHVLPRGILREPVSALVGAHAVVFTRSPQTPPLLTGETAALLNGKPIFRSYHVAYLQVRNEKEDKFIPLPISHLAEKKVYLFSAIARNEDFSQTVERLGAVILGRRFFSDHHRFTRNEIEDILAGATGAGADLLLTTEKDLARLKIQRQLPLPFATVGVRIKFPNDAFDRFVMGFLTSLNASAARLGSM